MVRWTGLLAVTLLSAGCEINGGPLTYPGASVFEPPARDFHFHYLSPPWRHRAAPADLLALLAVDVYDQLNPTGDALSHELRVSYGTGDNRATIEAARAVLAKAGHAFRGEITAIRALTGEEGWDLLSTVQTPIGIAYHRETAYTASSSKPVRFALTAAYPLDEQEVDDLLQSFSAGPDPGSVTPPRVKDAGVP
jgi:hypothetical protein